MYLSTYRFSGDPAALVTAYDRLQAGFEPGSWDLRACIRQDGGIVVVDACPNRAEFEAFSVSPQFRAALAAAGLPQPRVEPIGEVHDLCVGSGLVPR